MEIKVSSVAKTPMYEQIELQIKERILSGEYAAGTQLPSIRVLARELKVGIVTCKRAYDDLQEQGILVTHPGKGVFVAEVERTQIKDFHMEQLEEQLSDACRFAKTAGISGTEVVAMVKELFEKLEE